MAYRTSQARREFDRWSDHYDRDMLQRLFFQPSHEMLLDTLQSGENRILDIGCGTGQFAARVLNRHPGAVVCGLVGVLSVHFKRLSDENPPFGRPISLEGDGATQFRFYRLRGLY